MYKTLYTAVETGSAKFLVQSTKWQFCIITQLQGNSFKYSQRVILNEILEDLLVFVVLFLWDFEKQSTLRYSKIQIQFYSWFVVTFEQSLKQKSWTSFFIKLSCVKINILLFSASFVVCFSELRICTLFSFLFSQLSVFPHAQNFLFPWIFALEKINDNLSWQMDSTRFVLQCFPKIWIWRVLSSSELRLFTEDSPCIVPVPCAAEAQLRVQFSTFNTWGCHDS